MILNTGRVRDHWHTMTRTGKSQRLSAHLAEPYAEINPVDGLRLGIRDADLVRVKSSCGEIVVRALLSKRQSENAIFVPMHWSGQFASIARVATLVPPIVDPHSGQPALKNVQVHLSRFDAAWYGFAVLRSRPENIAATYWALARCAGGWRVELGGQERSEDWTGFARALLGASKDDTLLAYHDEKTGQHRYAAFDQKGLIGAFYIARNPVAVSRSWAVRQLAADMSAPAERYRILAGRSGADLPDPGAIVCACYSVGTNQITATLASGECQSVKDIGKALKAGTNCGSCRAEINAIINTNRVEAGE
ncbi:nitrate reductase [bacterium MnTg02]|nr:nitrate reductase [bacterium MnTg02]